MIKDVTIAAGHRLDGAHKSKKEIIPRKRSFRAQHRKQQNTEKYSFSIRFFLGFLFCIWVLLIFSVFLYRPMGFRSTPYILFYVQHFMAKRLNNIRDRIDASIPIHGLILFAYLVHHMNGSGFITGPFFLYSFLQ